MKFPLAVLTALSATLSTPTAAQDTHAQHPPTTPPGANYTSPLGVEISNPPQSFAPNGPWSLMSRAGPTLYIAGMRGFSPANNTLVESGYPRVRQAFENMQQLANMAGTDLTSAVRLVVYVSDMYRWRPVVNQVQHEMWGRLNASGQVLFPPRTIVEVQRLNDDDIVEVEGTFWLG